MKNTYRIETAKGDHEGTLAQCWAWQDEHRGACASLVLPSCEEVDVAECESLGDILQILREETETGPQCLMIGARVQPCGDGLTENDAQDHGRVLEVNAEGSLRIGWDSGVQTWVSPSEIEVTP